MNAEEQKRWIKEFQENKEKLEEVITIFNKALELLKTGEDMSKIGESMREQFDRVDKLIGEVYFGRE